MEGASGTGWSNRGLLPLFHPHIHGVLIPKDSCVPCSRFHSHSLTCGPTEISRAIYTSPHVVSHASSQPPARSGSSYVVPGFESAGHLPTGLRIARVSLRRTGADGLEPPSVCTHTLPAQPSWETRAATQGLLRHPVFCRKPPALSGMSAQVHLCLSRKPVIWCISVIYIDIVNITLSKGDILLSFELHVFVIPLTQCSIHFAEKTSD